MQIIWAIRLSKLFCRTDSRHSQPAAQGAQYNEEFDYDEHGKENYLIYLGLHLDQPRLITSSPSIIPMNISRAYQSPPTPAYLPQYDGNSCIWKYPNLITDLNRLRAFPDVAIFGSEKISRTLRPCLRKLWLPSRQSRWYWAWRRGKLFPWMLLISLQVVVARVRVIQRLLRRG